MIAYADVVGEQEEGFLLFLPCVNHKDLVKAAGKRIPVEIRDPRMITREQQKKAHAIIGDIARWYGDEEPETMKVLLKEVFGYEMDTFTETFSLAACSRTEARLFITWLIDFCILHDVPTGVPLAELTDDIARYVYAALLHHRCAVCGKRAELHHVDAVGMGRNRKEIIHIGMRILPLCRSHHTECHHMGNKDFQRRYFLEPVKVDERIAKEYKLKAR